MRTLWRALSELLTLFFGPRADGLVQAPLSELLFWFLAFGLLGWLVFG